VRNVGEWPGVSERRRASAFASGWLEGVPHQDVIAPPRQVFCRDGINLGVGADDDDASSRSRRSASRWPGEIAHDFTRDGNVKAGEALVALFLVAQVDLNPAEVPVVDVHHALPRDALGSMSSRNRRRLSSGVRSSNLAAAMPSLAMRCE